MNAPIAYHGSYELKRKIVGDMKRHVELEQIAPGDYWADAMEKIRSMAEEMIRLCREAPVVGGAA